MDSGCPRWFWHRESILVSDFGETLQAKETKNLSAMFPETLILPMGRPREPRPMQEHSLQFYFQVDEYNCPFLSSTSSLSLIALKPEAESWEFVNKRETTRMYSTDHHLLDLKVVSPPTAG